ncbi:MAG: aldo/keto reductase [Eggerthellaceae bacterium]|nr:aldo/keto reductase [Eggerthellaceae bacterium]
MDITIANGIELNDGKRIPRLAFGTFDLKDGEEATTAVTCAIEAGYRHIDCARFYGNEKGVGAALASCDVPRDELFVTSKVWNDRQIDGTVRESVEESLRDLRLDYLDLLLIHWPVAGKFVATWRIFEQLRDEGLVRSIGVSNFQVPHLQELLAADGAVPAIDQMERHPYLQDDETFTFCRENGIAYEAWSPLGRGGCLDDETIGAIAAAHGVGAAQVIIAWHMAHDVIPLPRSKNPERIRANATILPEPLTDAEMAAIDALDQGKPVIEGIDPQNFAPYLNALSSHF